MKKKELKVGDLVRDALPPFYKAKYPGVGVVIEVKPPRNSFATHSMVVHWACGQRERYRFPTDIVTLISSAPETP